MTKPIIPKTSASHIALTSLLAGEHLLIDDIPGTGKTNLAKKISEISNLKTNRIQCTNDLMPNDIIGYNKLGNSKNIEFHKGPIFTNILLVDEINRAPSRTQSSLLEAMEEIQVTVEGQTLELPDPFYVIATQNPRDQVGVFDLPESQIDRFSLCIKMDKLNKDDYLNILNNQIIDNLLLNIDFKATHKRIGKVHCDNKVQFYLLDIIDFIEKKSNKYLAIRPRVQLLNLARANATISDRDFIVPEDITTFLIPSLRHRLSHFIESEISELVAESLSAVKLP